MKGVPGELAPTEARRMRVLAEIGRGGFGVVWRAELLGSGGFRKEVAVKVLHRGEDDQEIARRLRDEARILGLIRHPGVVQVDGLVQLDGRWAVVMEFVDGADLGYLVQVGPLPPRAALEIVSEVARVLGAAWSTVGPEGRPLHLVHRDIKPSNVKITAEGAVKVLDFGVARAEFGSREARTNDMSFGTLSYMSPERLEWVDGPEGDIYALGAVLFEMLVGEPLGRTSSQRVRHAAHIDAMARRLRPRMPVPDPGVEALLRDMLAFEAAARPTPRDLEDRCDALADSLGGERLKRWAGRAVPELKQRMASSQATLVSLVQVTDDTFRTESVGADTPKERRPGAAAKGARVRPKGAELWRQAALVAVVVLAAAVVGAYAATSLLDDPPELAAPKSATGGGTPAIGPVEVATAPTPTDDTTTPASSPLARSARPATPTSTAAATSSSERSAFGIVLVVGDATVKLRPVAGGDPLPVGNVPVGAYELLATFPGWDPVTTGTIQVVAGETVRLECNAHFMMCRAR